MISLRFEAHSSARRRATRPVRANRFAPSAHPGHNYKDGILLQEPAVCIKNPRVFQQGVSVVAWFLDLIRSA
jgi:hypothetical protein